MSLITKTVEMTWIPNNIKWYETKGYVYTKTGEKFIVSINDLPNGSHVKVQCECDNCGKKLKNINWCDYKKQVKKDERYYCQKCAIKLYGGRNLSKALLIKNGKSFEQWCIENNRQDVLDRWDYDLNQYKPNEICYSTKNQYYLKCPKNLHKSELKSISDFTNGYEGVIRCISCNSFAQWGVDNISEDFLEKYWDWEKNTINPWKISYGSHRTKVWIKCQHNIYHESYNVACDNFTNLNSRCPECNNSKGEEKISKYLIDNNINYIPQKTFDGLTGLGNGLLSYDFYLPQDNLLIEYQGIQHEKYIPGLHKSKKDFLKQQEHDRRKCEYAQQNNIKLLEIWYCDFDNIEEILSNYIININLNEL